MEQKVFEAVLGWINDNDMFHNQARINNASQITKRVMKAVDDEIRDRLRANSEPSRKLAKEANHEQQ